MNDALSRSFQGLLVMALAICCTATTRAADAPLRLELGGEPAPENIQVLQRDGVQYVPALALLLVGWGVEWAADSHSAVTLSNPGLKVKVQLAADSAEAKVTAEGAASPITQPLTQPPIYQEGVLWLPTSALEDALKIAVEWDAAANMLRVGAPTPNPDLLRQWCEMLGIPDPAVFHRSGFRVKLVVPQGNKLPEGQEFPLNVRTNMDGCVQVYIKNGAAPPRPLWGVDPDGTIIRDPISEGCPEQGRSTPAWRVQRWRLLTTPGNAWVFAVATTVAKPPAALLDALKAGSPPEGGWAVDALEVTVVPRPDR